MTSEQRIRSTFSDLDAWSARTTVGFRPQPGSALAIDDEDWKPWRLSQLAFGGLAAAQDHLEAIRQFSPQQRVRRERQQPPTFDVSLRGEECYFPNQ
jgi:hypothetical protein